MCYWRSHFSRDLHVSGENLTFKVVKIARGCDSLIVLVKKEVLIAWHDLRTLGIIA